MSDGTPHSGCVEPSPWVRRFAPTLPPGGAVLDVACGAGRHVRYFLDRGHPVVAIDRDVSRLDGLADRRLRVIEADLESGDPWPLAGERFAAVVVTNYLHRPLLAALLAAVAPGGVLIYETFAQGNERLGKPRHRNHLLRPGELLEVVRGRLRVIAFEDVTVDQPRPACVQRICARREAAA